MRANEKNGGWDTEKSVNGLRNLAESYNAFDFKLEPWRVKRNRILARAAGLRDIDISVGFDTFLTSVVGYHSPSYKLVGDAKYSLH